jgi:hypothetical protein
VFKVFDLAEPGFRFFFGFVRTAEIFSLLGQNLVTTSNFFDHSSPSPSRGKRRGILPEAASRNAKPREIRIFTDE